jgi:hypothetical protein
MPQYFFVGKSGALRSERLMSRIRSTETRASTNPHLLNFDNGTTDALNEHLHADHGENQAHHSRNDLDAVVSDVFDDAFARDEEHIPPHSSARTGLKNRASGASGLGCALSLYSLFHKVPLRKYAKAPTFQNLRSGLM